MKRAGKIAGGVLALAALAFIVFSVVGQFATECSGQKISSAASPSGSKVAELYQTLCKSERIARTELYLVEDGARIGTEIGESTTDQIGLVWRDEDSLVVSVPPGMNKAFDRNMQGVEIKFEVMLTQRF